MKITFTNTAPYDLDLPKPASKYLPEWYKSMESYLEKQRKPTGLGETSGTIKRCIPVFDVMTAGFIIESLADVFVSLRNNKPWFEWSDLDLISFHRNEQADKHPQNTGFDFPKWRNYWGIETPKGYSCLFVPPFHRESTFQILPGLVDTDKYTNPVNFPFTMNNPKFEGLIPKGTPIAQVIPFKRDSWKSQKGKFKNLELIKHNENMLKSEFFDKYKKMFWMKKDFN